MSSLSPSFPCGMRQWKFITVVRSCTPAASLPHGIGARMYPAATVRRLHRPHGRSIRRRAMSLPFVKHDAGNLPLVSQRTLVDDGTEARRVARAVELIDVAVILVETADADVVTEAPVGRRAAGFNVDAVIKRRRSDVDVADAVPGICSGLNHLVDEAGEALRLSVRRRCAGIDLQLGLTERRAPNPTDSCRTPRLTGMPSNSYPTSLESPPRT